MAEQEEAEAVVTCKTIEELEARGPKHPPAGYSDAVMNKVWKYLDPDNSGTTSMQIILKQENRLKKDMVSHALFLLHSLKRRGFC